MCKIKNQIKILKFDWKVKKVKSQNENTPRKKE